MLSSGENFMKAVFFLIILLSAGSLSLRGQQGSDESTATTIRALEHEWVVGQSRNDNRALNLLFDNALIYVEYGKLVTKGEYLARIRQAGPELSQITMEPMTVSRFGNTAIVVGTYREKEMQKQHRVRHWRFIDTWVYKKNGWVLVAAAAAPISK
jgi:ketosteroid isomerase-like protein